MVEDEAARARVECALWFIHHDDVDEAARVLEAGDELVIGTSDYLDLAAALSRRGLTASYQRPHLLVQRPDPTGARKPPQRAPAPAPSAKKTASGG